jgi:DNA-binding response OmpR family regulator
MYDARPVILLVEMDEPLGRVVASYLHHDGYQVVHGDSLAAACEQTAASGGPVPDLWIVDLDSLDAAEQETQLAELRSLPVLLLASDPVPAHWERLLEGLTVLYKPFAIHELRQQVGDLLPVGGVTP